MEDIKNKNVYDYSPLFLISFYIIFTYVVYLALQPTADVTSFIFMSVVGIFVILGYLFPAKKYFTNKNIYVFEYSLRIEKIIFLCGSIVILYSLNFLLAYYSSISEILFYLRNPGRAYEYIKLLNKNPELNISGGGFGSFISIALTLSTVSKYILVTFSILYWKNLKILTKIFVVFSFSMYLIYALCIGSMITIGSLLISCLPIFLYVNKLNNNNKIKTLIIFLMSTIFILFLISNRIGSETNLKESVYTILFYLSHGYSGLEYALHLPFKFTFGFSTFRGISDYLVDILGFYDFSMDSYLNRNEIMNGWPALSVWSTIFPWLASDISFYNIPFVMFIMAYLLSEIWNKTLNNKNPYGFLLLGQFFIFWFMIPSNNQLFHTLENSVSFITVIIFYKLSKKNTKSSE